jgi:hypothetical protein
LRLRSGMLRSYKETLSNIDSVGLQMLTFFTTAKPFQGHDGLIQWNALRSWKLLHPEVEVILFGDEEGAREVCGRLDLRHEPEVKRHESGMKYVDYIFGRAQEIARHEILCYSNCDIIQFSEFITAVQRVFAGAQPALTVGRRWDTEIVAPVDFADPEWSTKLRHLAKTTGRRQDANFLDYFVFPKGLYQEIPPLLIGRSYWDHWLVWKALDAKARVVDCSRFVVAVHQNHDYGYHPQGKLGTNIDALAVRNYELSGNGRRLRSIPDSTHAMTADGRIYPTPLRRIGHTLVCWSQKFLAFFGKQGFLNCTFGIRKRLGLRREHIQSARSRIASWFQ